MTEERVRQIFLGCWGKIPDGDVLPVAQQAICIEVLLEISGAVPIKLTTADAELFLKMTAAITKLSYFHTLSEGALNSVPPTHWHHLGYILEAYKDATNYCYTNYSRISHLKVMRGKTRADIRMLAQMAKQRDALIKEELRGAKQVSFAPGEFMALHELFCFIILTILGEQTFSKYSNEMAQALTYLRGHQLHFITSKAPGNKTSKPS